MFATLRRSRLLGLTFALVVPGLTPAWLQTANPCPDMAPWLVERHAPGQQGHAGHGNGHPSERPTSESGHHQGCTCLGSCQVGADKWSPGESALPAVAHSLLVDRSTPRTGIALPIATPRFTLPLATAPPLS